MLQQLSIFFGRTIAIVARQKRGLHEGILRKNTAELTWHTFCWLFAWTIENGKKNSVDFLPNLHNHPYMCQEEVQRQKCVVLSFCLIIVKDKWRIERKILFYSTHLTPPHSLSSATNRPAATHPVIQTKNTSRRNRPQPKNEENFLHIFPQRFPPTLHPFHSFARRKMKIIFRFRPFFA